MNMNTFMRSMIGVLLAGCLSMPAIYAGETRAERKKAPGKEKSAYLGVATTSVGGALTDQLELPKGVGLVVAYIDPESPAANVLRTNDVLHKLNDQLLVNPQQLAVLVRTYKPGDKVSLSIIRKGQPEQVAAVLAEKDMPPLSGSGFMFPRVQLHPPVFRPWGGAVSDGTMDDVRKELEDAGLNMDRIGEVLEKLRRVPFGRDDGATLSPMPGGQNSAGILPSPSRQRIQSSVTSLKDGYSLTVNTDRDGKRSLLATDKDGKVVFDGPINTPEEMEKMPREVRERLKEMEGAGRGLTEPGDGASRKESKREIL